MPKKHKKNEENVTMEKVLQTFIITINKSLNLSGSNDKILIEIIDIKDKDNFKGELHKRIIGKRLHLLYESVYLDKLIKNAIQLKPELKKVIPKYRPIEYIDYMFKDYIRDILNKEFWTDVLYTEMVEKLIIKQILGYTTFFTNLITNALPDLKNKTYVSKPIETKEKKKDKR